MTDQAPHSDPQDVRDLSVAQPTVWRPEMAATPDPIVPDTSIPSASSTASDDATTVAPTPTFAPLPQWTQADPAHAGWARPAAASAPYAPSPVSAPPASPQFASLPPLAAPRPEPLLWQPI